jgi:phosphoglucosamine mutase
VRIPANSKVYKGVIIIMARMFGTDGVRGVAGTELTIELAMKLGQAGAYVLTKEQSHQPTIIIG